jgi:hypothetical protein
MPISVKIIITLLLCAADAVFTAVGIQCFYIIELNPLMSKFLEYNSTVFVFVKMFITGICAYILYRTRRYLFARVGIDLCFIVYFLITIFHCAGVCFLI